MESSDEESSSSESESLDESESEEDSEDEWERKWRKKNKRKGKGRKRQRRGEWLRPRRMVVVNDKVVDDIDELTKQLRGMDVQDTMYASTYAKLCLVAPAFKNFVPAPVWSGQQPANQQITQSMFPLQSTSSRRNVYYQNPPSPWSRSFDCYFCRGPNHGIRDCAIIGDYLVVGRIIKDQNGRIVFANNEWIPTHPNGIKGAVDECFQGPLQSPPVTSVPTNTMFGSSNLFQRSSVNASSFANISAEEMKGDDKEIARQREEEVRAFRDQYDLVPWVDEQDEDTDDEGMVWSAFAELERFNKDKEVDVFAATRSKGKGRQQSGGEKATEKGLEEMANELKELKERQKENTKDLPKALPTFERAYTNESRIADPQIAENLVNQMLDVVIPNVTACDILSLSGDARKAMVECLCITRVPTDPNLKANAQVHHVTSNQGKLVVPDLEFCTPLREMDVIVGGKVVEAALLDDGSEIVVIWRDLWKESGYDVNRARKMVMQTANLATEAMEGCVEYLELEVRGIQTWVHAFVVEQAPFRLLLGRPWQKGVMMKKEERADGVVLVTIHDPKDQRRVRVIETRERDGEETKGAFVFRSMESVAKKQGIAKPDDTKQQISKVLSGM